MRNVFALVLSLLVVILGCATPARKTVVQPVPLPAPAGPVINYFFASPANLTCPSTATLEWKTTGADNVSLDHGIGLVQATDNMSITVTENTTFTLTAMKDGLKAVDSTTVLNCAGPPGGAAPVILYFDTTPPAVQPGDVMVLVWQTSGADSVTIDHGIGPVATQGRYSLLPSVTTVYTLTATNASGSVNGQVTAQVIEPGYSTYYFPSYTTPLVDVQAIISDQFTILEDSSPSTGYTWIVDYYDSRYIMPVSNSYTAYNPQPSRGTEGQQQFIFQALQVGDTRILMSSVNKTIATDTHSIYYDVHIQPK